MRFTLRAGAFIFVLTCGHSALSQTNVFPANGNVGIGTTLPQAPLHLQSSALYMPQLLLEGTNTSAGSGPYILLRKTKSGASFVSGDVLGTLLVDGVSNAGYQQGSYLEFAVDDTPSGAFLPAALELVTHNSDGTATEKLRLTSKGKLGLGTPTPDALVQLAGVDGVNPVGLTILNQSTAGTFIKLERSSGAEGGSLVWDNNNVVFSLQTGPGIPLAFKTGGAEKMRVDSQGNVGIGTSVVEQRLSVAVADSDPAVSTANSIAVTGASGKITAIGSNSTYAWLQSYNAPLHINAAGNNTILNGRGLGNVGIGTLNPTYPLSVNGAVRAKEVIVDTAWSDYVFDDSYRLTPLSEVEAHIKAQKHLDGMPSAEEVARGGVRIGDIEAKLLAKIEELTLHQIEQEKEIARLRARLSEVDHK